MGARGNAHGQARGEAPISQPHVPVLLAEVLDAMSPRDNAVYVDGTFGAGGYSRALLEAAQCRVIAFDRDPTAQAAANTLTAEFGDRFSFIAGCFGDMRALLAAANVAQVDGVVFDLGVSSMQLDEAERGFSFMRDGPLDMRMGNDGMSATELVNQAAPELLADILHIYGEERRARAIAKALVRARDIAPITRTGELVDVIVSVLGQPRGKGAHPATRTFQALRIYLNDELGELVKGLAAAEEMLAPGGCLVVVTFHSLEDRIAKKFLARRNGREGRPSRHLPEAAMPDYSFAAAAKNSIKAKDDEIKVNPRARSARLRAAIRTEAKAFPLDDALLPPRAPRLAGHEPAGHEREVTP